MIRASCQRHEVRWNIRYATRYLGPQCTGNIAPRPTPVERLDDSTACRRRLVNNPLMATCVESTRVRIFTAFLSSSTHELFALLCRRAKVRRTIPTSTRMSFVPARSHSSSLSDSVTYSGMGRLSSGSWKQSCGSCDASSSLQIAFGSEGGRDWHACEN